MKSRDNILLSILIALIVLLIGTSYVRFVLTHDYMVAYEGACDPAVGVCFIGCEDDGCTKPYYYAKVEKYAAVLYVQCGGDITDCAAANACLPLNDRKCSVIYCDPEADGEACETISGESNMPADTQKISLNEHGL